VLSIGRIQLGGCDRAGCAKLPSGAGCAGHTRRSRCRWPPSAAASSVAIAAIIVAADGTGAESIAIAERI
jgi:hypothetical protein